MIEIVLAEEGMKLLGRVFERLKAVIFMSYVESDAFVVLLARFLSFLLTFLPVSSIAIASL